MTTEDPLTGIRNRIDQIDVRMHALLMARGAELDALARAKNRAGSGAAVRPAREAAIMRRLALAHEGRLPFFVVEHLWREIIATFTAIQSPYRVATVAGGSASDIAAIQDTVRFYFGFSVPVRMCADAAAAVAACAEAGATTLAVIPLGENSPAGADAWWTELDAATGPAVIARLPFVESAGHPIRTAAYVIAPTSPEAEDYDRLVVRISAASLPGSVLRAAGGAQIAVAGDDLLVEIPGPVGLDGLTGAARDAGIDDLPVRMAGGFHAPITVAAGLETGPDTGHNAGGDGRRDRNKKGQTR